MLTVLQHFRLMCELISRHKSKLSWSEFCINLRATYIQQWSTSTTYVSIKHTYVPLMHPRFTRLTTRLNGNSLRYRLTVIRCAAAVRYESAAAAAACADCTHVSTVWSRSAASLTGVSASRLTTAVDIGYCLWCRRWYISLLHVLLLWRQLLWVVHVYV